VQAIIILVQPLVNFDLFLATLIALTNVDHCEELVLLALEVIQLVHHLLQHLYKEAEEKQA